MLIQTMTPEGFAGRAAIWLDVLRDGGIGGWADLNLLLNMNLNLLARIAGSGHTIS
jgi:hypothetical protein